MAKKEKREITVHQFRRFLRSVMANVRKTGKPVTVVYGKAHIPWVVVSKPKGE